MPVSNSPGVLVVRQQEVRLVMKRLFYSSKPMPGAPRRREGGFTLVESMVVIAISAILVGLAAPSMRKLIERNGVNESLDSLTSSLAFARAEAIKRGFPVIVCRSTGAETNTPTCSSNLAWNTGWLVFADFDSDGGFDSSKDDVLLRVQGSLEKNGTLQQTSASYQSLLFRPTGTLRFATSFALTSPSDPSSAARVVCISVGGRGRVASGECGS
ncbi:GspH/FimT family pseudopilin [Variovorax sp. WS11]|uniref:GspH/FimT family pseudopilin n=2 Tax=Variovorax sp. WS11 TaxID=1105204 RepID=UPI001C628DEE|nr:GspH/FimT family pseudopilin [Variovorax sp. WS11]